MKEGRQRREMWSMGGFGNRDLIPIHWRGFATCSESASVCQEMRFESGFRTRRPGDPLNGEGRANGDRGEGVNGARRGMDSGAVADADASHCDSRPGVEQCANAQPTKE